MEARIDGRAVRYQHRREELLEAVAEYVLEHGVARLSLRRVAESAGISHVTLQYHFGTREELVSEIIEHLLERTLMPVAVYPDGEPVRELGLGDRLRGLWQQLASPAGQRDIRLFVEVLGQSQFSGVGYAPTVRRSMTRRLDVITRNVIRLGCPEAEARSIATLALATLRGLAIELLVTGERERLSAAYELVVLSTERRARSWPRPPG